MCWIKIWVFPFLLLLQVCHSVSRCRIDCSVQAGVPCNVITGKNNCRNLAHRQLVDSNFPTDLNIKPVVNGNTSTLQQLDVTWKYHATNNSKGSARGYRVESWAYLDVSNAGNSKLNQCIIYNFTSKQRPVNQTVLTYSCARLATGVIQLSVLPQRNPITDYSHRITTSFKQDYGDSSAMWSPALVVIHNDSCHGQVYVEFSLAPKRFNFRHYRVLLKSQEADVTRTNNLHTNGIGEVATTTFANVPDGNYVVKLRAEPDDGGSVKCYCDNKLASPDTTPCFTRHTPCYTHTTAAFIILHDHPKCGLTSTDTRPTADKVTSSRNTSHNYKTVFLFTLTPIAFIALVCICVLVIHQVWHKPRKPEPYGWSMSNESIITVLQVKRSLLHKRNNPQLPVVSAVQTDNDLVLLSLQHDAGSNDIELLNNLQEETEV